MKRLCIIPARSGSKRIPKKNIRNFLGKPIIAYSIETALKSGVFDEVMVSTDDVEIAEIAKNYGAKVPFYRSKENADDFATTFDVIKEVITEYQKKQIHFDQACCFYATAPLVSAKSLNDAFSLLEKNKFDTVFPAIRFGFPIQRALKIDDKQKMSLIAPEHEQTRSQDLEPAYHDAGQFYVFNIKDILNKGKLWTDNTGIIEISENSAQDIDNEVDWQLAELKYQLNPNK
jgi:N-acylneuraminate cytidylyltransferase